MPAPRPRLRRAQQVVATLTAALVLVMAVVAGRSDRLFGTMDIEVHGMIGNAVFLLAVALAVMALVDGSSGTVAGVAVALAVLTFAQVGLGYVGRDTLEAAAWHIPNGVLLMGLATAHLVLVLQR